jgi:hypothetical protein
MGSVCRKTAVGIGERHRSGNGSAIHEEKESGQDDGQYRTLFYGLFLPQLSQAKKEQRKKHRVLQ